MGFAPTWLRRVSPLLHMITLTTGLGLRIVVEAYKLLDKVTKCGSITWLKLTNGDAPRRSAPLRILSYPVRSAECCTSNVTSCRGGSRRKFLELAPEMYRLSSASCATTTDNLHCHNNVNSISPLPSYRITLCNVISCICGKTGGCEKLGADPAAPATVPAHGQNGVCGLWHHPLARSFAVFSAILPSPDILYVSKNLEHFRFLNNSVRHHPILIRFGAEYLENAYWIFHLTYFLISYSDQRSQWSILKSDSNVS